MIARVIAGTNINRIWADLIVDELVRSGVTLFCMAPGSRSAPLTTAVAAHPGARHIMHFDERGTAYYALGYARATGRPAAWITTSGTAVANGMPAVVEAGVDGVPLILLTADRPPELRDTGANQTIDQVKLFGDYVDWHFDLPAPDAAVPPEAVLTTVDQAVYRARRMASGPVHLNAMFREPLAPDEDGRDYGSYLEPLRTWRENNRPFTHYLAANPSPSDDLLDVLYATMRGVERGLVVAGRLATSAQADAVRWLSERLGWPLLPDAGSQLRLERLEPPATAAPYFDLTLVSQRFRAEHRPEAILQFGSRPVSKRLPQFLAEARPSTYVVVHEAPTRLDPHHHVTTHVESDVVTFCRRMVDRIEQESPPPSKWLSAWRSASTHVGGVIERYQNGAADMSEPLIARLVAGSASEDEGLFLASSMPVRDVDMYASDRGAGPFVASNRGASGIDGTVASATGFASGLLARVTLLIGDLALLHDLNSLSLAATSDHPLTIVVVNNHGGGIFSFLPIAKHTDVFETYFGTPHRYSFKHAAAMFGIAYEAPSSADELQSVLSERRDGTVLIEIVTDREANVSLHRRLEREIEETLEQVFA